MITLDSSALFALLNRADPGHAAVVETRYGVQVMDRPLGDLEAGVFSLACAKRNGGQVLTLDRRDFGVVAREGTITVLPR